MGMKKETHECRTKHTKSWTGRFGYFWVNDECTLFCHCAECNRWFEIIVNKKNFAWGSSYYKKVKIIYGE